MIKRNSIKTLVGMSALLLISMSARADHLSMTGSELYSRFCASCHGESGHGDGRAAKSPGVDVPDLTLIVRRQGGKFPTERIEKIIDGRYVLGAHGTRPMPIWGDRLSRAELGNPDAERVTQTIITRLVEYVRSIQRSTAIDN
jgi:mono/diheme cytochrome c family protein